MHKYLSRIGLYNKLLLFLGRIKFTRHKISLLDVLIEFIREVQKDDIQSKAQAMAFNFILAIFPGIIFLFTLIPYIPIKDFNDEIMYFLRESAPSSIYDLLADTIKDIVSKPRGGLLSFGFILSLYAAMSGTHSMMEAFNQCYNTSERRSFIKAKLVAAFITLMLVIVLILSITLLNVGEIILTYFQRLRLIADHMLLIINLFRYSMLVLMFFLATSVIYYLAPSIKIRWSFFSFGAVVATLINVLISIVFSFYVTNFATYNKLYGSIGTIIAMMLWFYLTSLVILIGFEFNASVDHVRHNQKQKEDV